MTQKTQRASIFGTGFILLAGVYKIKLILFNSHY